MPGSWQNDDLRTMVDHIKLRYFIILNSLFNKCENLSKYKLNLEKLCLAAINFPWSVINSTFSSMKSKIFT